MSMPGVGVLIGRLSGNETTVNTVRNCIGKTIKSVRLVDDVLKFEFSDGFKATLRDDGQSCCEHRYMRTDDDLESFVGATLMDMELKEAPNEEDEWGDHEVQFLEVKTDKGSFVMASHNEHNGYYGGFWIVASPE